MAKTIKITESLELIPAQLSPVLKDTKIEISKAEGHAMAFAPSMGQYLELAEIIKGLDKINPTEIQAKQAREARLKMVKVRTSAEEIKDLRKEGIKAEGDLIQALYNVVKNSCIVTETEFAEIEKHQERAEAKRQSDLSDIRTAQLAEFGTDTTYLPLGIMTDDQFNRLLENETLAFNARKQNAEKLEAERIESEKQAELARKEQERLQAERIEAERIEAIRVKQELARKEQELEKEREASRIETEKLAKENEAKLAEQKRLADIESKKQADILLKQKAETEKLAKELQAKKDAEAKLLAEQKSAELAPDKEKINALYKSIQSFTIPEFSSNEAKEIGKLVQGSLSAILTLIKNESTKLK